MTLIKERYSELVSLTQLFLLREYSIKEIQRVSSDNLTYFKKYSSLSFTNKKDMRFPLTPNLPVRPTPIQATNVLPLSDPCLPAPLPPATLPSPAFPPIQPEPLPTPPLPSPLPPQPPIIQDKAVKGVSKTSAFTLEPLTTVPVSRDLREFWQLFQKLFPNFTLCETIPKDCFAQKLKNNWLSEQVIPPVIILSFHDEEKQLAFLKNLAQAISLRLAPARVLSAAKLEKEKQWEQVLNTPNLRLVIASDYGLYLHAGLMAHYCETPQQSKHFLNQVPLLLLSDPALYLKEPSLKALLWRAICNEFVSSSASNA